MSKCGFFEIQTVKWVSLLRSLSCTKVLTFVQAPVCLSQTAAENSKPRLANLDTLCHRRTIWCLHVAPAGQLQSGLCSHIPDCRLNSYWSQQRASCPAVMVKGDVSAMHCNPCWGLMWSVWLRTSDVWCENLGNIQCDSGSLISPRWEVMVDLP